MDLVDRYLNNVRFFLPRKEQADIVRELADDLESQIAEREAALGRALTVEEVSVILKRCGPPLVVAGRYRPEQHLIGPVLFPIYWVVLKLALWFYLLPWLAVWIALVALSSSYRAAHPGLQLVGTLTAWVQTVVYGFAAVTVGFAVMERFRRRPGFLERWDPLRLPRIRNDRAIPRFTSLSEIVWGVLFLLWWAGVIHFPAFSDDAGQRVVLAWTESFQRFYWPVFLVQAGTVALACANLARPAWSLPRACARLAINLFAALLGLMLAGVGPWLDVEAPGLSAHARAVLFDLANNGMHWFFVGVAIVAALIAGFGDVPRVAPADLRESQPGSRAGGDQSAGRAVTPAVAWPEVLVDECERRQSST